MNSFGLYSKLCRMKGTVRKCNQLTIRERLMCMLALASWPPGPTNTQLTDGRHRRRQRRQAKCGLRKFSGFRCGCGFSNLLCWTNLGKFRSPYTLHLGEGPMRARVGCWRIYGNWRKEGITFSQRVFGKGV